MAFMLGKNLILEGDVNFLVKSAVEQVPPKLKIFLKREKDTGRPNYGLLIHMALMLGKNLILEGDVNFLVKSSVNSNYSPNRYESFRTNGYQKGHDQHHIMSSKTLTLRFR